LANTTTIEKVAKELPGEASVAADLADATVRLAPVAERAEAELSLLPKAVENASHEFAQLPAKAVKQLPGELKSMEAYVEAKLPVSAALPLPDLVFGGGVLVAVVILQAIGLRLLTGRFDKLAQRIEKRPAWWSVDLLLGVTVFRMLGLHLLSIMLWSAALVYGGIIPGWAAAARFAALSYTTLGSHLILTDKWYMLSPIIAISGMFTFAWTASVLVSIVGKCNELRGVVREARHQRRNARSHATVTAPAGDPEAGASEAGASRTW
jgi:hypothetical protein